MSLTRLVVSPLVWILGAAATVSAVTGPAESAAAAFSAEGKQPILVMSQECWEGLDPENRRAADQIARERRILVYTAECSDDDDVTAEVYAGE